MKKFKLIVVLLFVIQQYMYCQSRIGFAYDASGNRVSRQIVLSVNNLSAKHSDPQPQMFSDYVGNHTVKFTPVEPTGCVKVDINNLSVSDYADYEVYTIGGILLRKDLLKSNCTIVDLSKQPSGIYLLKVNLNGNITTWKVNKK